MIVEFWLRKKEIADEDDNEMEHTSEYGKSGVQLVSLD
jgi:hypothetical protein